MAIITCLIAYILFDSPEEIAHLHENSEIKKVGSSEVLSAQTVQNTDQSQIVDNSKTAVNENIHTHSHNNSPEEHNKKESSEENHHIIPARIKKVLCLNDNDALSCTVNLNNDLANILLDETGNMLAEEITIVLDSENFQDVLESLSTQKETNEAFIREDGYQRELNLLTDDPSITSSPLYCSEIICAMTMQYEDIDSSKSFFRKFFNKSNKGNIFLSQRLASNKTTIVERVMFFPENKNGVIVPELN